MLYFVCGDQGKVDSAIAAVIILENDEFPKVGTTVTLSVGGATVLTECNYAEKIVQWTRDRQFECAGGGKYYHFLTAGFLAKGTRAKATSRLSENGSGYYAKKYLGYTTTSELMLEEHYLPNTEVICGIRNRASSLSVAYLFKQGGIFLNSSDVTISVTEAGFEITGNYQDYVMGSITLEEIGDCEKAFSFASDASAFIKELKKKTEFTFGTNVVTGLIPVACGSAGKCKAYSIAPTTAFTLTPDVNELVSCGNFELVQNCDTPLAVAGIAINSITGEVAAIAGLPAGSYKFQIKVSNDCCIMGSTCFTITVA